MREADGYTINGLGTESQTLMERAGKALFEKALQIVGNGNALCVCGGGNNGGDGFICARLLRASGIETDVVCVAERFSADGQTAMGKYLSCGGVLLKEFPNKAYSLVIDCLLGTGFKGELSGVYKNAIERINGYKTQGAKVLSADIPSGVNGDNGRVSAVSVNADYTVCLGEYKAGVFLGDGIDCAGEISRADIGISLLNDNYAQLIDKEYVKALLPKRKRNSHKGSYGKAAIVAGSLAYTGAGYLSTLACLRSGAGYTTLFTPKGVLPYYILRAPEALIKPLCDGEYPEFNESVFENLLAYDSIAYGMGMGVTKGVAQGVEYLLKNYQGKLVLDADALNSIALFTDVNQIFQNKQCDVVLTPHLREFSRLCNLAEEDILQAGMYAPNEFSKEKGVGVYLKNAVSILTDGQRTYLNQTGNSGQAKGGSGDVLSGVIAGLCAQGLSAFDGALVGGYIVGKAAEIVSWKRGEYSLLASDIIDTLGEAFLSVIE